MASNDVVGLSDRMHVRTRFGMYLSSADNPQIGVREVIDNSIDEILVHRADTIKVWSSDKGTKHDLMSPVTIDWINNSSDDEVKKIAKVLDDNFKLIRYTVCDNGGGIPIKETTDVAGNVVTMTEFAMGSLRSGSKFDKTQVQAGMNGLGTSATNFTCCTFSVYSRLITQDYNLTTQLVKDNWEFIGKKTNPRAYYKITFCTGIKVSEEVVIIDNEKFLPKDLIESEDDQLPSTITSFIADPTIWHSQSCTIPMNTRYLKYMALKDGYETHFFINNEENTDLPESYEFEFKCHIQNQEAGTKNDFMDWYVSLGISDELENYSHDFSVNTLSTQTGYHQRILTRSLTSAIQSVFGDCQGYECYGINILCIFTCPEPAFASQTKERLSDIPGFSVYAEYPELVKAFVKIIKSNYDKFFANYQRVQELIKSKANWSRLDEIKSKLAVVADSGGKRSTAFVPHKLKDCTCKDRTQCELYICEGTSAGSSLCKARAGTNNVAILPLKGRPKNTSGMDIVDILENAEMYDLINAIGCGVNDYHSLADVRYGKVIIATDSDSDGYAIANLILGVITQQMTFLLENGMVYIAVAPLYEQDGKRYWIGEEDQIDWNREVKRYKGLGEVNSTDLYDFVMNPKTRKLIKVTTANMEYANALLSSPYARKELMINKGIVTEYGIDIAKHLKDLSA